MTEANRSSEWLLWFRKREQEKHGIRPKDDRQSTLESQYPKHEYTIKERGGAIMERRKFIEIAGMAGLAGLVGKTDIATRESVEFAENESSMSKVVTRTVMDTERLVFSSLGLKMTLQEQLAIYQMAADAIDKGVDPFQKDFWQKVKEAQPEDNPNTTLASYVGIKQELRRA